MFCLSIWMFFYCICNRIKFEQKSYAWVGYALNCVLHVFICFICFSLINLFRCLACFSQNTYFSLYYLFFQCITCFLCITLFLCITFFSLWITYFSLCLPVFSIEPFLSLHYLFFSVFPVYPPIVCIIPELCFRNIWCCFHPSNTNNYSQGFLPLLVIKGIKFKISCTLTLQ